MDLSLLKLKYLINQPPESIDVAFEYLDNSACPPIVVFDANLAKKIFKSQQMAPLHLLNFWKALCGIEQQGLPSITRYFINTPLLLDGADHFEKRKQILKVYSKVEQKIDEWLDTFVAHYFYNNISNNPIDIPAFVTSFVRAIGQKMVMSYLDHASFEMPKLPTEILHFVPSTENLTNYDEPLGEYIALLEKALIKEGLEPSHAYPLMSIVVMGTEPLIAALCHAISQDPHAIWDLHKIFAESVPVRVIGRYAKNTLDVGELTLQPEQRVYLDIYQINRNAISRGNIEDSSFSFGYAMHLCPGRSLSFKIASAFARYWIQAGTKRQTLPFQFTRDLLMRPIR